MIGNTEVSGWQPVSAEYDPITGLATVEVSLIVRNTLGHAVGPAANWRVVVEDQFLRSKQFDFVAQ